MPAVILDLTPLRRACSLAGSLLLVMMPTQAQRLSGVFGSLTVPDQLVLFDTHGADHAPIDSVRPDPTGTFAFPERRYPAGFYQLAVNDTDRVDIILDPREREVRMLFDGTPLQEHLTITTSIENQRMWEYKQVSRHSQARIRELQAERGNASPMDLPLIRRVDSLERAVRADQQRQLDRLVHQDTASYFSMVVRADRALMVAIPKGFAAIRDAFGWEDPQLLHSSIHSKAVLALLQNVPADQPDALERGCDSLLQWSAACPDCWRQVRWQIVQLFDQYGPDPVADHLVDTYVIGPKALVPPEPELLRVVADRLRTTVGAQAPEVSLPDPLTGDTAALYSFLERNRFTALFFYSSTCDHCHEQMPGLKHLYTELHGRGFELLGIALDADTTEFKETVRAEALPWPSFSELRGWGSPAAKAFAVKATPALFLVDNTGRIVARPADHIELRSALAGLLP